MKQCYICGKKFLPGEKREEEHIVAHCLYTKKDMQSGERIPKADAHPRCNGLFSALDDYMRDILSFSSNDLPDLIEKRDNRMKDNAKYRQFIYESITPIQVITANGDQIQTGILSYDASVGQFYLTKIVRGLVYYYGMRGCGREEIPREVPIFIEQLQTNSLNDVWSKLFGYYKVHEIGNTWKVRHIFTPASEGWHGLMEITLLKSASFLVSIGMSEEGTNPHESSPPATSNLRDGSFTSNGQQIRFSYEPPKRLRTSSYPSIIAALETIRTDLFS